MINAHSRDRIAVSIGMAIVAGCGVAAIWGASTTDAISSILWEQRVLDQMLCVAGASTLIVILARFAEARGWLAFPLLPGLALAIWTTLLFGWPPVLAVSAFLVAALSAGSIFAALFRAAWDAWTRLVTGAAALALLFTWISGLPVNSASSHAAMIAAVILSGLAARSVRSDLKDDFAHLAFNFRRKGGDVPLTLAETLAAAWLVGIFGWLLSLSALPEVYHDALAVHLYVPSFMSAHLKWSYDPELYAFAVMPMAVTHLYAHLFMLGGEGAARLLNVVSLALACVITYRIIRIEIGRLYALTAVGLFVSTPVAYIESATLFIENLLSLWIVGSVYVLLRHRERLQEASPAVLCILAAACAAKLHGVLIAAILGAVLVVMIGRKSGTAAALRSLPFAVCAAILGAYPYLCAYRLTGNPLFPFFNDIFKSPAFDPVAFVDYRWIHPLGWNTLYAATFDTGNYMEAATGALGLTWLVFLPAAVFVALYRWRSPAMLCLALGASAGALIFSQIQYLRYVYPFMPLMTIAVALLLQTIDRSWFKWVLGALVVAVASFNAYKIPSAGWVLGSSDLRANFDGELRRQYEEAFAPEKIANRMINDLAGAKARVLYTGPPFGGLLEGTALYGNWYSKDFRRDGGGVTTAETAARYLTQLHVGYVVHRLEPHSPFGDAILAALTAKGREIAKIGQLAIYEIKP